MTGCGRAMRDIVEINGRMENKNDCLLSKLMTG